MAFDHLRGVFEDLILTDQDLFASEEGYEALLDFIPEPHASELRERWSKDPSRSSRDKWSNLNRLIRNIEGGSIQRVRKV